MNECVSCGNPTDNTQRATIGNATGEICEDCAYWCDGNLIDTPRAA